MTDYYNIDYETHLEDLSDAYGQYAAGEDDFAVNDAMSFSSYLRENNMAANPGSEEQYIDALEKDARRREKLDKKGKGIGKVNMRFSDARVEHAKNELAAGERAALTIIKTHRTAVPTPDIADGDVLHYFQGHGVLLYWHTRRAHMVRHYQEGLERLSFPKKPFNFPLPALGQLTITGMRTKGEGRFLHGYQHFSTGNETSKVTISMDYSDAPKLAHGTYPQRNGKGLIRTSPVFDCLPVPDYVIDEKTKKRLYDIKFDVNTGLITYTWTVSRATRNRLAHALYGNGGPAGGHHDTPERKCHLCGKTGHIKRNCPASGGSGEEVEERCDNYKLCEEKDCRKRHANHYHAKRREGPKPTTKPGAETRIAKTLAKEKVVLCKDASCLETDPNKPHYHQVEYSFAPVEVGHASNDYAQAIADLTYAESEDEALQHVCPNPPISPTVCASRKSTRKRTAGKTDKNLHQPTPSVASSDPVRVSSIPVHIVETPAENVEATFATDASDTPDFSSGRSLYLQTPAGRLEMIARNVARSIRDCSPSQNSEAETPIMGPAPAQEVSPALFLLTPAGRREMIARNVARSIREHTTDQDPDDETLVDPREPARDTPPVRPPRRRDNPHENERLALRYRDRPLPIPVAKPESQTVWSLKPLPATPTVVQTDNELVPAEMPSDAASVSLDKIISGCKTEAQTRKETRNTASRRARALKKENRELERRYRKKWEKSEPETVGQTLVVETPTGALEITFEQRFVYYSPETKPFNEQSGFTKLMTKWFGTTKTLYNGTNNLKDNMGSRVTSRGAAESKTTIFFGLVTMSEGADYTPHDDDMFKKVGFTHREERTICRELYQYIITQMSFFGTTFIDEEGKALRSPYSRIVRETRLWSGTSTLVVEHNEVYVHTVQYACNYFLKLDTALQVASPKGIAKLDFQVA